MQKVSVPSPPGDHSRVMVNQHRHFERGDNPTLRGMRFANNAVPERRPERRHFLRCVPPRQSPRVRLIRKFIDRHGFEWIPMGLRGRRSGKEKRVHLRLPGGWHLQRPLRILAKLLDTRVVQVPERFYVSAY